MNIERLNDVRGIKVGHYKISTRKTNETWKTYKVNGEMKRFDADKVYYAEQRKFLWFPYIAEWSKYEPDTAKEEAIEFAKSLGESLKVRVWEYCFDTLDDWGFINDELVWTNRR